MAASMPLQKVYIIVVNNVDYICIYINAIYIYTHTLFSYVIYGIFICILFDVIVFNMLKVICIFCSVSSMCRFHVASALFWCLQGQPDVFCASPRCCTYAAVQLSSPVTPCLEPHHLPLVEVLLKAIRSSLL